MRGQSSEQLSIGESFLDPSLLQLDNELSKVDKLLQGRSLLKPFEDVFHDYMGRPGTPVDVYLRMLFLKFRWGLSYEEVEREVKERIPWRLFCHLSLMDPVPDSTTLIKLNQRFGEERIRELNRRLVKHLLKKKAIKPRKLRIDSTTIEAHVSYPTDVKLLSSAIKTLTRTTKAVGHKITSHVRSAKKALARMGQSLKVKTKAGKRASKRQLKKMYGLAKDTVAQSRHILHRIRGEARAKLSNQIELSERILQQTEQRLRGVKSIPDRIVSFYDPDVRPIRKGKLGKPTEFGRTLHLTQEQSGIIVDYQTHVGHPNDKTQALPMVKRFKRTFRKTPKAVAMDKGYYSADNLKKLRRLGIPKVCIPKIGRLNGFENRRQKSRWFRKLRRFRIGIEAAISMLKRKFSLGRIFPRGRAPTEIWVGFSLFSYNLWRTV